MRFYVICGVMSIGESKGGLLFDSLVEDEVVILEDCICVVDVFYDLVEGVMVCVGIVLCFLFFVFCDLMCDVVIFVWDKGVMLYIYFVENVEDVVYLFVYFGCLFG